MKTFPGRFLASILSILPPPLIIAVFSAKMAIACLFNFAPSSMTFSYGAERIKKDPVKEERQSLKKFLMDII
jgi:hypothetical protein